MLNPDGSVTSSSQEEPEEFVYDQETYGTMLGIVISVQPSDDKGNLTASVETDQRGYRHEATVLITSSGNTEPNMLLENVVIPPKARSNHDDYDEDLPVGVSQVLDGQKLTQNWANIDPAMLDGDYCVIQFLGGSLEKPYIANWWPHPKNKIDPATSGQASYAQFDTTKKRSRKFQRVNGVERLVTAEGDVYLDTSRAGSKLDLSGDKPVRKEVTNGGSVQVDIKSGQQLELNWNAFVEGLKAGSNSQSQEREVQRSHLSHNATGSPPARSTGDTILRFKRQEGTVSTGKMVIYCHKNGGGDGFAMMTAEDGVVIGQGEAGAELATLAMAEGKITISTPDGDNITLDSDAVSVSTQSGGAVTLSGDKASVIAPGGLSLGTATPSDAVVVGTLFMLTYLPVLNALQKVLTAAQGPIATLTAAVDPPGSGSINNGNALVPLWDAILKDGKMTELVTVALAHGTAAPAPAATPPTTPWLSKLVSTSK
jgi:hypothetical protein